MATYLLLWNPRKFTWPDLPNLLGQLDRGEPATRLWGIGNRTHLEPGSDFFLLQTGEGAGIRARGITVTPPVRGRRLEEGDDREDMQVRVKFTDIQDRQEIPSLPRHWLQADPELADFDWNPQRGGVELPPTIATRIASLWEDVYNHPLDYYPVRIDTACLEGELIVSLRVHRRREHGLRSKKIVTSARENNGQAICEVCRLNMTNRFGQSVESILEVHHRRPLGERDGAEETRLEDLAVVCPTCHRFLHSRFPIYTVEEAATLLPHYT